MAAIASWVKGKFSRKSREGDRRKRNSEKPEDNADKPEEPRPCCSTQKVRPNEKECKDDADSGPSSSHSGHGDHAYKNENPRNDEEKDKGKVKKESKRISMDNEPTLERPDYEEDCKNESSENASSRSSLKGSAENIKRESFSEGSSANLACENESSDESLLMVTDEKSLSLGSMVTDTKPLSGQTSNTTYEASNNLSSQDNELVTQLQDTEIINATQDKSNGLPRNQLENNLLEVQDLGIEESTREAEEHSLQVHVQEQAHSKVEPLVSDILSKKEMEDRISLKLNKGSLVLANWENLACELKAPPHIKAQCRRTTNESPTELLFDSFKSWRHTENLTVNQLIGLLYNDLKRKDAVEVIENAIPAHKRENKVSDEITNNPELLEELATKLDKESRVLKNWRNLGLKLEVKREILQEIGNGNSPNAVEALFEYIYSTMPGLTVEEFKEKIEKINRVDVRDLLINIKSGKMNEVVPLHGDLMCTICYMLNKNSTVLKNWRHLASELGVDYNTYKSFEPDSPQSPTSILLEWVCSEKGNEFTVREFCKTLARMKRYDVIELIEIEFGEKFREPSQL